VNDAERIAEVGAEPDSLADYLWGFVGGDPTANRRRRLTDIRAETAESRAMSKE
jgi:DNA-3-methyladenine glycosylase I